MNMTEFREKYATKKPNHLMKDKKKAIDIIQKILKCHKCGETMNWVEGTNICVCPKCVRANGDMSVFKVISDKSHNFLEYNSAYVEEIKKEDKKNA